ncbi:transglycosylase domain-containing protein [Notoacmeibacter marinus]|uniref:transglycosylase domain-containing protein n=1 Tax=Notoacmeibacter marinus TaxID=1876515 RepID=UPI0013B04D04|nr:transglycosylase domain-containing protein [Notoacmeibacter marinus]
MWSLCEPDDRGPGEPSEGAGTIRRFLSRIGDGLAGLFLLGTALVACAGVWLASMSVAGDYDRASLHHRAYSSWAYVRPGSEGIRAQDVQLVAPLHLQPQQISETVREAFLTAEDRWFEVHPGFNPLALARAIAQETRVAFGSGENGGGGSTITQQLVKNLILTNDRDYLRKFRELLIALRLETMFSKDEILAMYLNNIFFGQGAYGIEAAARTYFGRSTVWPRQSGTINTGETALLALSVRAPSRANPDRGRKRLEAEARDLIAAMRERGFLTASEATNAALQLDRRRGQLSWSMHMSRARDFALGLGLPTSLQQRQKPMVVSTTIEPEAQLYAERAVARLLERARRTDRAYDDAAVVILRPDGAIAAMSAAQSYGDSGGFNVLSEGRRSPGSTIKPFIYLCAFADGKTLNTQVADTAREFRNGWTPRNNDGRYLGGITMARALALSRNPPAVALWFDYADCFKETMTQLGVSGHLPDQPSAVLGTGSVSPLDIARWYAALANGGHTVDPYAIWYARSMDGRTIFHHDLGPSAAPSVLADRNARCTLEKGLKDVVSVGGSGRLAAFAHPMAGKTGTSQNGRDAWFAGYTGRYVAVVWLGAEKSAPRQAITGGGLPALIFANMMATLHQGKTPLPLPCDQPARNGTDAEAAAPG